MKIIELERVCHNCNNFFPASVDDITEFGICLNDEKFEQFIGELLENYNYACCQSLVDEKKFTGDREACSDFSQIEIVDSMPIRLTQVDTLGYDPAYVRLPSDSVGVSASLP